MNIASNYGTAASSAAWGTQGSNAAGGPDRAGAKQGFEDFKKLKAALKSGDLDAAKQAYAAVQKDMQNAPAPKGKGPLDPSSPAGQQFAAIGKALDSGDVSGAQQAFQSFTQGMQGAHRAHHHHPDGDGDDGGAGGLPPTGADAAGSVSITNAGFSAVA